jgi:hypothetical protein
LEPVHITNARRGLPLLAGCAALVAAIAVGACTSDHGPAASPSTSIFASASAGKPPTAAIQVEANKARVATSLKKNTIAHVVLPPVDEGNGQGTTYEIQPAGTAVLKPVPNFPGYFRGVADGTATVVVRQQSPCARGNSCSGKPTDVGSVVFTITGS